jgi:hypothetical protein
MHHIETYAFKLEEIIPFFLGPLHTIGSSLLDNRKAIDITASCWLESV